MTPRRLLFPLTAALILGYFLYFVWPSLRMYFDSDDMYALYFAWSKPWSQVIHENLFFWQGGFRPLGAFFYRGIFAAAGYNPLPFRIADTVNCPNGTLGVSTVVLGGSWENTSVVTPAALKLKVVETPLRLSVASTRYGPPEALGMILLNVATPKLFTPAVNDVPIVAPDGPLRSDRVTVEA